MSEINLSKAVRSNLLSLQNTANLMAKTQGRLATGLKVNSALDNPTNFFTASSLNSRAGDINQLLDSMANGIQTLEAADNGLKAITKTLESMQSTLRQARQDKSFKTESFTINLGDTPADDAQLTISGGSVGAAATIDLTTSTTTVTSPAEAAVLTAANDFADIDLSEAANNEFSFDINGDTITLTQASGGTDNIIDIDEAVAAIQAQMDALNSGAGNGITVSKGTGADANKLVFTTTATGDAAAIEIDNIAATGTDVIAVAADLGFGAGANTTGADEVSTTATVAKSVDALVSEINKDFAGQLRASNDNGKLRIENLSTGDLTVEGLTDGEITGGSGSSVIEGNAVRADLANQYNELRDQLDKLADDASFNGINLLRGDNLKITFNETGTSELDIRSKDEQGINAGVLELMSNLDPSQLDDDGDIDTLLDSVKSAINDVRSQASAFGSSLSIVQNRQDFSKNMINTLQTGAANLTLADTNEEAANLLALQTRQQLSSTALSMASQADQAVLRLF